MLKNEAIMSARTPGGHGSKKAFVRQAFSLADKLADTGGQTQAVAGNAKQINNLVSAKELADTWRTKDGTPMSANPPHP